MMTHRFFHNTAQRAFLVIITVTGLELNQCLEKHY